MRPRRLAVLGAVLALAAVVTRPASPAAVPTAIDHLRAIVTRSQPPDYRRLGSSGMAQVAAYAGEQLGASGLHVLQHNVPLSNYQIDYAPGHAPELVRVDDGKSFKVESAFDIKPTGPDGITCTVKTIADVGPGDCGFVPFAQASPDFRNVTYDPAGAVDSIIAAGGVGAVVQGDVPRNLVLALRLRKAVPAVIAVANESDVVGRRVRLRAMGGVKPSVAHNTVAVMRPPAGSTQYTMLLAHADGWFAAAADNGGGAAAVLRATQLVATAGGLPTGLLVAVVDGEEWGLLGSKQLAADMARPQGLDVGDCGPTIHLADIKAVVNLDAPSARASDVQDIGRTVIGTDAPIFQYRAMVFSDEPTVASLFLSTFAAHGVLGLPINATLATEANGGITRTDGRWFDSAGIPVAWPVAGYPEYHTDGDTLAAVDPADLEAVADAAAELVQKLAAANVGRILNSSGPPPATPTTGACAAVSPSSAPAGRTLPATP